MCRRLRNAAFVVLIALSAVALTACQEAAPKPVPMPAVVHDVVTRYVPIPKQYTAPLAKPERASNRIKAVVKAFNERGETIDTCNWRLDTIDALGGQVVAPAPAPAASAGRPP